MNSNERPIGISWGDVYRFFVVVAQVLIFLGIMKYTRVFWNSLEVGSLADLLKSCEPKEHYVYELQHTIILFPFFFLACLIAGILFSLVALITRSYKNQEVLCLGKILAISLIASEAAGLLIGFLSLSTVWKKIGLFIFIVFAGEVVGILIGVMINYVIWLANSLDRRGFKSKEQIKK